MCIQKAIITRLCVCLTQMEKILHVFKKLCTKTDIVNMELSHKYKSGYKMTAKWMSRGYNFEFQ